MPHQPPPPPAPTTASTQRSKKKTRQARHTEAPSSSSGSQTLELLDENPGKCPRLPLPSDPGSRSERPRSREARVPLSCLRNPPQETSDLPRSSGSNGPLDGDFPSPSAVLSGSTTFAPIDLTLPTQASLDRSIEEGSSTMPQISSCLAQTATNQQDTLIIEDDFLPDFILREEGQLKSNHENANYCAGHAEPSATTQELIDQTTDSSLIRYESIEDRASGMPGLSVAGSAITSLPVHDPGSVDLQSNAAKSPPLSPTHARHEHWTKLPERRPGPEPERHRMARGSQEPHQDQLRQRSASAGLDTHQIARTRPFKDMTGVDLRLLALFEDYVNFVD